MFFGSKSFGSRSFGAKSLASKILGRLYKFERDPHRAGRVYREFAEKRGFADFEVHCRAAFTRRELLQDQDGPLQQDGVEYLDVLPQAQAQRLLDRLTADHPVASVKKNNRQLLGFRNISEDLRRDILESLLHAAVDEKIARYFRSEYLVLWMTVTETRPRQEIVSFRWHCDKGPRTHLKLIVYLNASDEHGGNTEFVPLQDSVRVAQRGYVFGKTKRRTSDIAHLSAIAGAPLRSHLQPIAAGGGVLFQPAAVLHRGISPSRAPRYAITLCLLPSPVHWSVALARGVIYNLGQDEKWPGHVRELTELIGR